jgi:hypothetical protein
MYLCRKYFFLIYFKIKNNLNNNHYDNAKYYHSPARLTSITREGEGEGEGEGRGYEKEKGRKLP